MKTASTAMVALLNSNTQFIVADLFEFAIRATGEVLRYTSADIDLTYSGNVYSKSIITRSSIKETIGITVDTLDITFTPESKHLVGGIGFYTALNAGALNAADFTLRRAFMPTWGDTSAGAIKKFIGRVADVEYDRQEVKIKIKSATELMNIALPRKVYEPKCVHNLFDVGCALDRTLFAANSSVNSASDTNILCSLGQSSGYYALGKIQFNSGVNSGKVAAIKWYEPGSIALAIPLDNIPAAGDTFTVWPGCDRLKSTCESSKFNNRVHFRGYPFMPNPETAH